MRRLPLFAALVACPSAPAEPPPGVWFAGELHVGDPAEPPFTGHVVVHEGVRVADASPPPGATRFQVDRITPGFVDAHAHPVGLGRKLTELDLQGLPSLAATLDAVRARADGEGWLVGRGWDQNDWPDAPSGGWPTAAHLDAITGARPTVLRRVDGHASWVNSAALRAAGVGPQTPDPPGGRILRGEGGAPTGVLIDAAADLIPSPKPDVAALVAQLRAAQNEMLRVGLVGAHDMGVDDATLAAYRALAAAGELEIRVWVYLDPTSDAAQALLRDGPTDEGRLRVVGIKAYADGALGSRGAHLLAPYDDEPSTTGLRLTEPDALSALAVRCLRARAQLAVHAIGDAAAREVLDVFERARAAVPEADQVPLRLEHAQVVSAPDRARLRGLGVIASVQPTHATSDHPWAEARLGLQRVFDSYAWRELADAGASLALGSDFPVEDADPAWGLWAATTRTDASSQPTGGWRPEQALTSAEAIAGFTTWAGAVVGDRRCIGAGCAADLTLWRRVDAPPGWRAVGVVIDGQVVRPPEPAR
jgi:predicted amidohydrolase YtcJ